jgi:hypothetical protein
MHRQFLKMLSKAKSESKPVIAVNLDVRGFSKFSLEVESVETALYVRKMDEKVLTAPCPLTQLGGHMGRSALQCLFSVLQMPKSCVIQSSNA